MAHLPPSRTVLANYPWSCVLPTRYGDLDPNWHINNAAFVGLFEEGRVRFALALGDPVRPAGVSTVVAALNVNFLAETFYPTDLTLALGIVRVGRTSWTVVEGAFNGGQCLAVCEAVMVSVGPDGPVAAPQAWRDAVADYLMAD